MIICPACSTQNPNDGKFCIGCGIDLKETATQEKVLTDSVDAPVEPPPAPPQPEVPPEYLAPTVVGTPPESPAWWADYDGGSGYWERPGERSGYESPAEPEPTIISRPRQSSSAPPPSVPYGATPTRDRTLTLVLELVPAFFGFFGIGWMYGGNLAVGLILLIGIIVWNVIGLVVAGSTFGGSLCCTVPLNIVFMAISGYFLYDYTKKHPETFGS